jgi:Protein of unknown function (DUF1257)
MSQSVTLEIVIVGLAELVQAVVETGLTYEEKKQFETEDGRTHTVDLVVTDEQGSQVGVKVDKKTGVATFVAHDGPDGRGSALFRRVAQRYAYSRVLAELKVKGYQVAKEEKQKDGTIKLVAQRWR